MASEIFRLFGSVVIDNRASGELDRIGKKVGSTSKAFSKFSKGVLVAGGAISGALIGLGTKATLTFSNFEQGMANVKATANATDEDMKVLTETAKQLGKSTSFSAKEAADGMNYLAMAGFKTNEIVEAMPGLLDLAAAGNTDLATTSDIVSDSLTAFGLKAEDTAHFADIMAKASSTANTNVTMLGESFKYAAPVAKAFGMSAEETTTALAMMANSGIKASQAGTSLRGALTRLSAPPKEAAEALNQLNIATTDAQGNMLPFNDIMGQLRNKYKDLSQEQQLQATSAIFGKNAMSGMMAVLNTSTEDFDKYTESLINSSNETDEFGNKIGAASKMAKTQLDTLQGSFKLLSSATEGAFISIGEKLAPTIRSLAEWLTENMPMIEDVVTTGFNLISTAIDYTVTPIKSLIDWMKHLSDGADYTTNDIKFVFTDLSMILDSLIHGDIGQLMEDLYQLIADVFGVKIADAITGFIDSTINLFQGFFDFAMGIWSKHGDNILEYYKKVWNLISGVIETALNIITDIFNIFAAVFRGDWEGAWKAIGELIEDIWNGILEFIQNSLDLIISYFKAILPIMKDLGLSIFKFLWEGLKILWSNIIKWLSDSTKEFIQNFKDIDLFQIGKDILNGLINGLKNMWGSVKDTVGKIAESIKDRFKEILGIHSPSKVFYDFGNWLDEGLAQGIEENSHKPKKATESLAEKVGKALSKVNGYIETTVSIVEKKFELWKLKNQDLEGSSKELEMQLELQKQKHEMLNQEIENTQKALELVTQKYGENSTEAQELELKLLDLQIAQQGITNEMQATTEEINNQSQAYQSLGQSIAQAAQSQGLNLEYDSSGGSGGGGGFRWGTNDEGKTDTGNRDHDRNGDGRTSAWEDNVSSREEERDWVENNRDKAKEIADKVEKEEGYRPDVGEIKDRYDSGDYHIGGYVSRDMKANEVNKKLEIGEFVLSRGHIDFIEKANQKWKSNDSTNQIVNHITINQTITDKSTADYATNSLINAFKNRGLGGVLR